jgi:hypothetical protein
MHLYAAHAQQRLGHPADGLNTTAPSASIISDEWRFALPRQPSAMYDRSCNLPAAAAGINCFKAKFV